MSMHKKSLNLLVKSSIYTRFTGGKVELLTKRKMKAEKYMLLRFMYEVKNNMAIFEPIDILKIANECGISEYSNVFDLKDEFERILKTPKYVIGFLKYREQINDIKRAISMLEGKEEIGYKIVQNSLHLQKEIPVLLDSNEELNLFIQLNRISEADLYSITEKTRESVKSEIMILTEMKELLIGNYFLMYLHYLNYIDLDEKELEKVYSKVKDMADSEYYLDRNYKKIAQRLDGVHGSLNNFCHYALKLPLFLSIYEYKRRNKEVSYNYLVSMLQIAKDYEIRYEEKLISLLEETYILYEIIRRLAYGEGVEREIEDACYMTEAALHNFNDIGKDEILRGYIYLNPSKKQISAKELKSLLYDLLSYTSSQKNGNNRGKSKPKEKYTEDLYKKQTQKKSSTAQSNRDWNRVNKLVKELDAMQGLASVKRKVHEILDGIKVSEYKKEQFGDDSDNRGTMHLIFTGNAGTGKTTVARILGRIYGALGILENEELFVECGRADLVGEYVGHTAPKVKKIVESAIGGILFIDEAYSLTDGGDAFGTEAVNTLLAEVENHRKELIVILAGYHDKMQEFLKSNQGLSSRFCTEIYFEDYSPKDMVEIIKNMAANRPKPMSFMPETEAYLFELFKRKSSDKEIDFGNARGVRNEFEAIMNQKSTRIAEMMNKKIKPAEQDIYVLQLEDVIRCSQCGSLMNMREGRYGKFMSCKNSKCKNTMSVKHYFKYTQYK